MTGAPTTGRGQISTSVKVICGRTAELLRERGLSGAVAYCASNVLSLPRRVRAVLEKARRQLKNVVQPGCSPQDSSSAGLTRLEDLLLMTTTASGSLKESVPLFHSVIVASASYTYHINMNGRIAAASTRDPIGYWAFHQYWEPNLYVRLENVGAVPVINPWLRRKDLVDTRSPQTIVDSLATPDMSDAEKARRLWQFEINNRFHATSNDEEVDDAVKRFNAYGYTLCFNESKIMSDLWRAAGLKVRRGFANGHSTAEVHYDGAWHLMDSDESIICLLRDNKTIASEAQIVADHDLMKRTHTSGVLHFDDRFADEKSAALHYYEDTRTDEHRSLTRHRMNFDLRPGEAITWAWNPGNRFHGREFRGSQNPAWIRRWHLAEHVMNGELCYVPDLTSASTLRYLPSNEIELRDGPVGMGLYPIGRSGSLTVPVSSPYPIVGGQVKVEFGRAIPLRDEIKVSISFEDDQEWQEAGSTFPSDYDHFHLDLNELFPAGGPARYAYLLRLDLLGHIDRPLLCLRGLHLRSTLQMAQLALPGLNLGDNSFEYTDQSDRERKVKITHAWRECVSAEIPGAPAGAISPPDGGAADGTRIRFRWLAPAEGPPAADYEFQLSEFSDLRWVVSPNFHKLISRTADRNTASYQLPYNGLLNPDETYYWRVRARSREGIWGCWSRVFSFHGVAPSVPTSVSAHFDPQSRTVSLRWKPGTTGTRPQRFRIYGSTERGFTASDAPYELHGGVDGILHFSPNLLVETVGPVDSVVIGNQFWRPYFRIVAVDGEGRESGPSDVAELPHPLIRSCGDLPDGEAGSYYQAQIDVSASIGHLVSADKDGRPYDMRFRAGDELIFGISGAPESLSIGPETGLLAGYLSPDSVGKYALIIQVTDKRSGVEDTVTLSLRVCGKRQSF